MFTLQPEADLSGSNQRDEAEYTLADFYDNDMYPDGVDIFYIYDLEDSWEHSIKFLGRADSNLRTGVTGEMKVACLGGGVCLCLVALSTSLYTHLY